MPQKGHLCCVNCHQRKLQPDALLQIVVAEKNIDKNKILAKKASYDYERGKTVIGVEIYVDGFEYDVELDAMTGAVQKWN